MAERNFVVTVKEREEGQPCSLHFELYEDIGLGRKMVVLEMPHGKGLSEAAALKEAINSQAYQIKIVDA